MDQCISIVEKAIDEEAELEGPMPESIWRSIQGDKGKVEELMRNVVRATKNSIRQRAISALKVRHLEED